MIQVRDNAGNSGGGEKWSNLGCSLEIESARLLRNRRERKREVKGDSKIWGLYSWANAASFVPMGKAAKETGLSSQVRVGWGHREHKVGRIQMNWEGKQQAESVVPGTFGPTLLRLPLVRGVAKGKKSTEQSSQITPKVRELGGERSLGPPSAHSPNPVTKQLTMPLPFLGLWWTF